MLDCPRCGSDDVGITHTRKRIANNETKRVHTCNTCNIGWTSTQKPDKIYYEIMELMNKEDKP